MVARGEPGVSFIGDFIAAIEGRVTAALPAYTLVSDVRALSSIPPDQYPAAMVANPSIATDRLDFQQDDTTIQAQVFLLRSPGDVAQLRTDVETLRTSIYSTPDLGGIVDDSWISDTALDETQKPRVAAGLIVSGKAVR